MKHNSINRLLVIKDKIIKGKVMKVKVMSTLKLVIPTLYLSMSFLVFAGNSSTEEAAKVYILSPANGAVVTSPVTVRFGLSGMGVAPAGVNRENTGHHHLLIDVEALPDMSRPIPSDKNHRHFGGGQTEVMLDLMPGQHRLQLLLGDYSHIPHNPSVLSEPVIITVE